MTIWVFCIWDLVGRGLLLFAAGRAKHELQSHAVRPAEFACEVSNRVGRRRPLLALASAWLSQQLGEGLLLEDVAQDLVAFEWFCLGPRALAHLYHGLSVDVEEHAAVLSLW